MYDKIVVVTRKTRLEELVERFNTREQAKFYIEHMGLDFADYDREHETYHAAVSTAAPRARRPAAEAAAHRPRLPAQLPLHRRRTSSSTVGRTAWSSTRRSTSTASRSSRVNPDPARYRRHPAAVPAGRGARRRGAGPARAGDVPRDHHGRGAPQRRPAAAGVQRLLVGQRTHVSARYSLTLARAGPSGSRPAACSSRPAPARPAGSARRKSKRTSTWLRPGHRRRAKWLKRRGALTGPTPSRRHVRRRGGCRRGIGRAPGGGWRPR